jgi:hypothetical protein
VIAIIHRSEHCIQVLVVTCQVAGKARRTAGFYLKNKRPQPGASRNHSHIYWNYVASLLLA